MTDALIPPPVGEEWGGANSERRRRPRAVELRNAGVYFEVGLRHERSLARVAADAVRRPVRAGLWAIKGIDLDVHAGDCVAIVGANGAGKSTLLQVIAGLLTPDSGYVRVRGRVNALMNLGVGFDPRLTGRENVELMGGLFGLTASQTRSRLDEVVEFAELGEFIDAPLRTYSSGMRARLGFAAAAAMVEPNVLVLDEVMGTGDAAFREKSRQRVMDLMGGAHAIILATHDMTWVAEFASYAVLLERGELVAEGSPAGIATLYRAESAKPPKPYGCPACNGQVSSAFCPACGVLRHG